MKIPFLVLEQQSCHWPCTFCDSHSQPLARWPHQKMWCSAVKNYYYTAVGKQLEAGKKGSWQGCDEGRKMLQRT